MVTDGAAHQGQGPHFPQPVQAPTFGLCSVNLFVGAVVWGSVWSPVSQDIAAMMWQP